MDNDPAFEKIAGGSGMQLYRFDHTKVPKNESTGQVRAIRRRDPLYEDSNEVGPWA